jgi:SAM-dependent methyltransferase
MQRLELGQSFDRVIAPFSALYCLPDAAALTRSLRSALGHLSPGGQLIADVWNAEAFHQDGEREDDEPSFLVETEIDGRSFAVYESSRWDRDGRRLTAVYDYRSASGVSRRCEISHRYFLRAELEQALAASGARSWQLYGDFARGPWRACSELTLLVAC